MDKDKAIALLETIKYKVRQLQEHEEEFRQLTNEAADRNLTEILYLETGTNLADVMEDRAITMNLEDAIDEIRHYEPSDENDEDEDDEEEMDEDEDAIEAV